MAPFSESRREMLSRVGKLTVALGAASLLAQPTTPRRAAEARQWLLRSGGVARLRDGSLAPLPGRALGDYEPRSAYGGTVSDLAPKQRENVADSALAAAADFPNLPDALQPMLRQAVADLDALTLPSGFVYASWPSYWRYHWPRDAAFAAVAHALLAPGAPAQADRAVKILETSAACVGPGGEMPARLARPGSCAVPDSRPAQNDGPGWSAWALFQVAAALTPENRSRLRPRLLALQETFASALLALRAPGKYLPRSSPDYWEVPEKHLTLGIAGPYAAGVAACAATARLLGGGNALGDLPARSREALDRDFAPYGYRRRARLFSGRDAVVATLLPPFAAATPERLAALRATLQEITVPVGGVRPGTFWHDRATSWTPALSLLTVAQAQEPQMRTQALANLSFLAEHLTAAGSLPEKINASALPAGVAPLTWTCANVIICAHTLGKAQLPVPSFSG
ncbi:glycoside hydrolase family 15 [Dermabacteraceae bacterium P13128]